MAEEKPKLKEEELLQKFIWDILPCAPPYPPIPRGLGRAIFGREFEKKFMKILPPFRKET